jgi:hypothetical protein
MSQDITGTWLPVFSFEDHYEASNTGNIRRKGGNILKGRIDNRGRLQVNLSINNKIFARKVHILVAQTFLGVQPANSTVEHINKNLLDNRPENLHYVIRTTARPTRVCRACGREFPNTLEHFPPRETVNLDAKCRECASEYKHGFYIRSGGAEKMRLQYPQDRARRLAANQQYIDRNREKKRSMDREHYRQNKGAYFLNSWRRKARKRALPNDFTEADWQFALSYFNGCCAVCGAAPDLWLTIAADHWIPLNARRADNPGTVPHNIVPLCHSKPGMPVGKKPCNQSKKDKHAAEWLTSTLGKKKAKQIMARIDEFFSKVRIIQRCVESLQ